MNLGRYDPFKVIRRADAADSLSFANVIVQAQSTWLEWGGASFEPYELPKLTDQYTEMLRRDHTQAFMLFDALDTPLAVAAAVPESVSYEPSTLDTASAHLSALFTLPQYHGTGVSQTLHNHTIDKLAESGYKTARLWVPSEAGRSVCFYTKNLWDMTGGRTYFAGLERLEMRRAL